MASIVPELQSLAPSAIIELFELHTSLELHGSTEIYRFHSGANQRIANGDVVWAGNRYQRFPIDAEGFEYTGTQLPRPTLRVANLFSVITSVLLNVNELTPGNDLIGAKIIRIRTCARYLDAINFENNQNPYGSPDPTAEAPREIYFVDRKVAENRDFVEFELAAAIDLANVKLPGRQCISSICQWKYRGPECGYTGSAVFDENDNPGSLVAATNFPSGTATLTAGQTLQANQFLTSSNRWYKAVMQEDGNFVVYNKALKAVWSTLTYGKGISTFNYQTDGNLVVYDALNRPTWNSNTQNVATINSLTFSKLIPDRYPRGDADTLAFVAAPNFPAGTSSIVSTADVETRTLRPGEFLTSPNGWYRVGIQGQDGNLVVYNKANDPVWNIGTASGNGLTGVGANVEPGRAVLQQDGNFVVYANRENRVIYNSGTYQQPTGSTAAANFPTGNLGYLLAGNTSASKLTIGQNLYSPNGWYRLKMQSDGNLVLYSKAQNSDSGPPSENYNVALWSTQTAGSNATYAHFQEDGNLVLYRADNSVAFNLNKSLYPQNAGKKLALQNDGNLVVYGTGDTPITTLVPATDLPTGTGQILCANLNTSKLNKGDVLYSENGWYSLTMDNGGAYDGNLVLRNKAGAILWKSAAPNSTATYAYFQADGNLVLYNASDVAIWWVNRGEYPQWAGYRWKLEPTGNLVLYSATNGVLWQSFTATSAEPSVTQTSASTSTPLWNSGTYSTSEPRTNTYLTATLAISNTGNFTITIAGSVTSINNYSNANEPQVEVETGDNRQHAFLWEIFGSADSQSGQTRTVSRTFTIGTRTITFSFVGTANFTLPAGHYSGQTKSWTLTSATNTASTGKWYLDEWLDLLINTSESNPFRNHPNGTLSPVGRQYRINGVLSSAGSLTLGNDGNLVQYDTNSVAIWSSNYSSNLEPKVPANASGFGDVCGKRLSSCEARFGANADLPFGSFPGVGQFFA